MLKILTYKNYIFEPFDLSAPDYLDFYLELPNVEAYGTWEDHESKFSLITKELSHEADKLLFDLFSKRLEQEGWYIICLSKF